MKYINYNRKSTDSEDKQILSIVAQEEAAQELAIRLDFPILEKINESKSAKIANKRPGFDRMVSAIKRGKYNAIVCWKLDRLARNMVEGGIIIELLQQGKIQEIRTPGRVYTSSENSILLAVEFGSANQYSRDLSVNVKRGQKKKAQMGIPHGLAIYGFSNNSSAEKGTRSWKVNENELNIMRTIFKKMLEGTSTGKAVYRWAMQNFHLTTTKRKRTGGKPMAVSYFYRLLRNPIYAGFFEYDGETYGLDTQLPRIISAADHYKIREMLTKNTTTRYRHESPYVGFITSPAGEYIGADYKYQLICDCKHKFSYKNKETCPMCGKDIDKIEEPKYLTYAYYYNVPRKKQGLGYKVIAEKTIQKNILEDLQKLQVSEPLKRWITIRLTQSEYSSTEEALAEKQRIAAMQKLQEKKARLRTLLIDGIISKKDFLTDAEEIEKQLLILAEEKTQTLRPITDFYVAVNAAELFKKMNNEEKRHTLSTLGSNLTWDDKNLYIYWTKWVSDLKKCLEEARRINPQFEPEKTLADKDKTEVFASVRPTLLKTLSEVRKHFKQ